MTTDHDEDLLRARHVRLDLALVGERSLASEARARVERIVRHDLGDSLDETLSRIRGDADGLWFIRRLSFQVDLDLGFSDRELARVFAARLLSAFQRRVHDRNAEHVCYFASRADYLGRFAVDLALGRAVRAWYYRDFEGLAALPRAAALRTALLDEPELGLRALATVPAHERAHVFRALTNGEARRVLAGFARIASGADIAPASALVARAVEHQAAWVPASLEAPAQLALAAYVELVAGKPNSGDPTLERACLAAATLVALRRSLTSAELGWLVAWLDESPVARQPVPLEATTLLPLLELASAARSELVDELLRDRPRDSAPETRWTRFGGVFWLVALLAELPLGELERRAADPDGVEPDAALRLAILGCSQGATLCAEALADPLVRELVGLDARASLRQIRAALAHFEAADTSSVASVAEDDAYLALPEALKTTPKVDAIVASLTHAVLRNFARRLPGFTGSSLAYLRANFLDCSATVRLEPERWLVRLGRVPLNVIVSMTGMGERRLALPWHELPFELTQEDE